MLISGESLGESERWQEMVKIDKRLEGALAAMSKEMTQFESFHLGK